MNVEALDLLATSVFLVNGRGPSNTPTPPPRICSGGRASSCAGSRPPRCSTAPSTYSPPSIAAGRYADVRQLAFLRRAMESVEVSVTTVGLTGQRWPVLIEAREIEQRVLADRSHRLVEEIEAHRELLRNLAHEVKNPLGGLRGAASCWRPSCPMRRWPSTPGHHFRSRPPAGAGGPPERTAARTAERAAGEHPRDLRARLRADTGRVSRRDHAAARLRRFRARPEGRRGPADAGGAERGPQRRAGNWWRVPGTPAWSMAW